MDGVFVPNISFGFPVLNALKSICQKPMDVHLMIVEPQKFIPEVAATGAYMMNVHYEACTHLHRTVVAIKETGMKAGVTLNPAYAHLLIRRYYPRCGYGFIDVRESGIWWSTLH